MYNFSAGIKTILTNDRLRAWLRRALTATALLALSALAQADYKDDIGYTALAAELGASTPDGTGVPVSQIEASIQVGNDLAWMPNLGEPEFLGKVITDESGAVPGVFSNHANAVGKLFYGNTSSIAPAIDTIASYNADHWLVNGFLRVNTGSPPIFQPLSSASRVSNHSFVGSAGVYNEDALSRLDWAIETDETLQVTAFAGGTGTPLLSAAYNVIAVNHTSAPTDNGSASAGGIYTSGRTKPEIVVPEINPSNSAPRISSAAALLVEFAHNNPGLSTDPAENSITNRNGDTIYNAERVEVIKAALMAGADRKTSNTTSIDITDYRVAAADQTINGLDRRFGAGQLNIQNSYQVISAGEQNSIEDHPAGAGQIASTGFDYDPAFGGSNGTNDTAIYYLNQTTGTSRLTASLVWNLAIDGGTAFNFDGSATLYDLNLKLFDVTDFGNWILVGSSVSSNENTENLWQLLDSGKNYALRVKRADGAPAFEWDYGLAWQVTSIPPLMMTITYPPGLANVNEFYWWDGLTATGGEPPYTWSLVSGSLPAPMTLDPDTGVIKGTPTYGTMAYFTVQVMDTNLNTATIQTQITVINPDFGGCTNCHQSTGF